MATWKTNPTSNVATGDFAIYIDGSAAATSTGTTGTPASPRFASSATYIGSDYNAGNKWNGSLTHVAGWAKALTSTEVSTLYGAA